jgi:hypothetical protein
MHGNMGYSFGDLVVTTPKIDENRTLIGLTIEDIIFLEV